MSHAQNPIELLCKSLGNLAQSVQNHLSHLLNGESYHRPGRDAHPIISLSSSASSSSKIPATSKVLPEGDPPAIYPSPKYNNSSITTTKSANPVSKEELGRATWTLLHTLGAQFPDRPTRQQKKDVKELMAILSRLYPCKECADHFKDVLSANPVEAGSQAEFSKWLCHVHNVVNRSLGKVVFPCQRVDARWGKLDCKERACDLEGSSSTPYRPT